MQLKSIFSYNNYLCFVHLLKNEVYHFSSVTKWGKIELLVRHNQTFSLMKTLALSLILVRVY